MKLIKRGLVKKIARYFFVLIFSFLFFSISTTFAQDTENSFHIPGTLEGTGKHFEITDSEYLNISLDSSERIDVRIESMPEMIILQLKSSPDNDSAEINISGLSSKTTYHKYEDDYQNYAPLITNEYGAFSFEQDLTQDHIIFIQPRKSTKIIKDDATGYDCGGRNGVAGIGNWNASSKTCTLNKDVQETIQINSDDITLDGNGHNVTGSNTGNGIYALGKRNIIKNINVSNFSYGIYLRNSGSVTASTATNNYYGIYVYGNSANPPGVTISNNSIFNNHNYGISLFYTKDNEISDNIVGPGHWVGLFQTSSENSIIERNDFFENQYGLNLNGDYNNLNGNTIRNNSTSNFYLESSDMSTNSIGTDNTIDGMPIYYEKNVSNETYDSINMGAFYCANCQNITLKNISFSGKEAQMFFWHTDNSFVEEISSADKSIDARLYYSSNNTIAKNTIGSIRIYKSSNENKIYNNNIMTDDSGYTIANSSFGNLFNEPLPTGGNYWKANESTCRDLNNDKICDTPFYFDTGEDDYPWIQENDFSMPSGNSNVMFLPGIKASRLYKKDSGGGEDQLWEPNYFGNDLEDLTLDENGESVNSVYTRDVIDEIGTSWLGLGPNIYKTFINQLALLKNDGTINDYNIFAYDWRQSVEDIAENGTPYNGEIKSAIAELESLAGSSKSKKVTLVAHSNGGLLAKAIMLELEKTGKADKVDKIVFVGTPQMGTPKAILSMLYGYDESAIFGTLISESASRKLVENMPGAYGLLPSEKYFERTEEPFINFLSENTKYKSFMDAYQSGIDSFGEFREFLTGSGDGREKPDENDVESENKLSGNLFDQAGELHDNLDGWTAPENIQIIEIAGWGLDTITGVDYTEKEKAECYSYLGYIVPSCAGTGKYEPVYEPKFTVDGDKVVTAPSALMLPEGSNVKRYWVDLYRYNHDPIVNKNQNHSSIFEVSSIQQFLSDIIKNTSNPPLPEYIKTARPNDYNNAKPRIRMSLYSPLDIHLYDENGNHTGPKKVTDENGKEGIIFEENIPNSYYYQFGDRKYVGVPGEENIHMTMDGYDNGAYTLKMEEVMETVGGEEIISHTTFADLPVSPETSVAVDIPESGLDSLSNLEADFDGNGEGDYEVIPIPNGEATLPDMIPPQTAIELSGTEGDNNWYASDVAVKLTAVDNEGGSGVNTISYSFDNGASWQEYFNSVNISGEGIFSFQYFSTDKKGNKEEIKTESIKIDRTAPEAKFTFDQNNQKFNIIGMDNLSQNIAVETEEQAVNSKPETKRGIFFWIFDIIKNRKKEKNIIATLRDEAGNETKINFTKKENNDHFINIFPESISYNGVKTDFSKSSLQYKWLLNWRKKNYVLFGSHIMAGDELLESHYLPKRNETWIMQRPRELDDDDNDDDAERRPVWKKLSGMVVPFIQTEQGKIEIKY
ncbi:MAG: right-handed parallel beta-helix repeat-containing protein [Parcubacteria group bacterium]|jgi:parallel beta-helix repeat protein